MPVALSLNLIFDLLVARYKFGREPLKILRDVMKPFQAAIKRGWVSLIASNLLSVILLITAGKHVINQRSNADKLVCIQLGANAGEV